MSAGDSKASEFDAPAAAVEKDQDVRIVCRIGARPRDVYELFTDPRTIMRFTRAEAKADPRAGGAFSLYDGAIYGQFVELHEETKVVQKWKFDSWPRGVYSTVTIYIKELDEGDTKVTLVQSGIPLKDKFGNVGVRHNIVNGWEHQIFTRVKHMLGYSVDFEVQA